MSVAHGVEEQDARLHQVRLRRGGPGVTYHSQGPVQALVDGDKDEILLDSGTKSIQFTPSIHSFIRWAFRSTLKGSTEVFQFRALYAVHNTRVVYAQPIRGGARG